MRPWRVGQTPQRLLGLPAELQLGLRGQTAAGLRHRQGSRAHDTKAEKDDTKAARVDGVWPSTDFRANVLFVVEKRVALAAVPDKVSDALAGKAVDIVNPAFFTVSAIQTRVRVARATFKVNDVGW